MFTINVFTRNTFRTRAENVLQKAKQVKQALDDAETAQNKASDAIEVAKNNIALADNDLEKVIIKYMKIKHTYLKLLSI